MNLPIVIIGLTVTGFGLFKNKSEKELTPEEKESKKQTHNAKNVPSVKNNETNENDSNASDSQSVDADDLGKDEKPE